jgi:predicted membrane-bound spermidine synthase
MLSHSPGSRPPSWPLLYLAVALTTLGSLLLELSLTRIFSVVFYYHFAFLAISIALFGLGAGGVLSYVVSNWQGRLYSKLGVVSLINAGVVLLALLFVLTRGADITTLDLGLIYFSTAMPFLGSGIIVSLAISHTIERVHRIYFFDLIGAAGGCLALVLLLNTFGGPNTVIAVSVLFAAAAAIWFTLGGLKFGRIASVFAGLLFTMLVIANTKYRFVEVRYAKGQKLHEEQFTKWNSISRIGMAHDKDSGGEMIYIDADASTGIANFDFNHLSSEDLGYLMHQGPGIPYNLRPGAKTLVIGPGGGWDVSRALASGSRDITGVEINPIIGTAIMRQKFPQLSKGLYLRPDVHIYIEDGRSFIRRSPEKYQVIQATLVDTWASTAAGAFALSENNLYTTEAFRDYLAHLTDDGLLTFTRWGFDPPRESLRLVSLAIAALGSLGEHDVARHVLAGRAEAKAELAKWGAQDTVMISRRPLSQADITHAREAFEAAHMTAMYVPGDNASNAFGQLLLAKDPGEYERNFPFDITPVSDNRPFFFSTVQPRDIAAYLLRTGGQAADVKVNVALPKLFSALIVSIAAVAVILLLPPLLLGAKLPHDRSVRSFLVYFLAIGAGYILIEVALIQKFVLFLGHPTYALTVVIFSMLVSSGLGSFLSRKMVADRNNRLVVVLAIAAALVGFLAAIVQPVLTAGVGLPLPVKMLATVALIAPAGFFMGIPFPTGLRLLEKHHEPSVRWAWSLNAAASVLGSVAALMLALYLGLIQTMLIGGGLYLCALVVIVIGPAVRERVMPPVSERASV